MTRGSRAGFPLRLRLVCLIGWHAGSIPARCWGPMLYSLTGRGPILYFFFKRQNPLCSTTESLRKLSLGQRLVTAVSFEYIFLRSSSLIIEVARSAAGTHAAGMTPPSSSSTELWTQPWGWRETMGARGAVAGRVER
jgi:hypothetical protein